MTGAGAMDQPISIERKTSVSDGAGGSLDTWAAIANGQVWAAVRAAKATSFDETLDNGRINAGYKVSFTIYTIADLTEVDRIVWNGETYNIRGILRSGNPLTVQVDAERGVAS